MKTIRDYAKIGSLQDVREALVLLADAFVSQCSKDAALRTTILRAGESWIEKLAWLDEDTLLNEKARCGELYLPRFSADYDKFGSEEELFDMTHADLLDCCQRIIADNEFDELTKAVLCRGISEYLTPHAFIEKEVEAVAPDGTQLKGILKWQDVGSTSIILTSPYKDVDAICEYLVKDVRLFLVQTYNKYQKLLTLEKEIRALYPEYKAKLKALIKAKKHASRFEKARVFDDVFGPLFSDTSSELNSDMEELNLPKVINEWLGLEFYDPLQRKMLRSHLKE